MLVTVNVWSQCCLKQKSQINIYKVSNRETQYQPNHLYLHLFRMCSVCHTKGLTGPSSRDLIFTAIAVNSELLFQTLEVVT